MPSGVHKQGQPNIPTPNVQSCVLGQGARGRRSPRALNPLFQCTHYGNFDVGLAVQQHSLSIFSEHCRVPGARALRTISSPLSAHVPTLGLAKEIRENLTQAPPLEGSEGEALGIGGKRSEILGIGEKAWRGGYRFQQGKRSLGHSSLLGGGGVVSRHIGTIVIHWMELVHREVSVPPGSSSTLWEGPQGWQGERASQGLLDGQPGG